ncbi:hypothetical protein OD91_0670 [Lutibacter sp. Hel_I_33_5]|uniref:DUF6913 domain-containing protein n=1 Tax=Lutibacter sp. Hel_I_33_5 TaxID=1566289 RepID=UPI0011A7745F|nr:hypothetical protein [Lutibacter sp. Hel_I_33_5]TVZ55422.1 hypothetical protein OD91_0670 [Lutibacter sp. Hel_I_33_5]
MSTPKYKDLFKFVKQKNSSLLQQYQKLLEQKLKDKTSYTKEIKSVGILTTDEISSDYNLQFHIEKILNVRNSKIYSFRKHDKDNPESYKHFSDQEISKSGKILDVSFKSFIEHPFDLLICFFDKKNVFLEYTALLSEAQFKAGIANVNKELYDLQVICKSDNIEDFTVELKKYLQILNRLPLDS